MQPARIAVIGAGLIGRTHIAVLRAGHAEFTLAGVADPSPAATAEGQRLGYPVHATIEAMLDAAKPDGAIVAVPNQLHVAASLACVARGVPVLVEKPIADTLADAMTLVTTAEKAGVATLTGHHRRHNPIMRTAARIIRDGGIGRVVAVTGLYLSHKPTEYYDLAWRRAPGGGPVLINAIHDIDCLRMLCGDIVSVQASASNAVRGFAVEDTAAAVLRFESGALGTLMTSDTASSPWNWEWGSRENPSYPYEPENSLLIAGTLGSLAVPTLVHRWHEPGKQSWHTPLTQKWVPYKPADAYIEQMLNFAAVIRGTAKPVVSGRDGALTLATTLAITEAARSGQPVLIEDVMKAAAR